MVDIDLTMQRWTPCRTVGKVYRPRCHCSSYCLLFFFPPGWPHLTILLHNTHSSYILNYLFFAYFHLLLAHSTPPSNPTHRQRIDNMPGLYCPIHSPHTDPGVKVGNMTEALAHDSRHVGKKIVEGKDPRPGRLAGDAGPSRGDGGDGDGDQGDVNHDNTGADGKEPNHRPSLAGTRKLGRQTMNVSRPRPYRGLANKKSLNPASDSDVFWKPLRAPPPPP